MSYYKLKSLIANVNAIETGISVRLEKRKDTSAEKETLFLYSGFGGIKEIIEIGSDLSGPNHRTFERVSAEPVRGAEHKCEINRPNVSGVMAEQIARLENLISYYPNFTDPQRKDVIEGIKASVLTAFYTPKYIIDVIA